MPSRAWVVTSYQSRRMFRCNVSMPSRAWVVTARIYNILNFSWYFLYIPAIYKCILAYFPIFFNQVSIFCRGQALEPELLREENKKLQGIKEFQCPHGLELLQASCRKNIQGIRVSMPSRAWVVTNDHSVKSYKEWVSMPSRAYTSFLRYPFKNLDFMRFPEPVFAGIYQNILTAAVFCAC